MIIAESRSKFIELLDVMMFAYLRLLLASGFSSSLFVSSFYPYLELYLFMIMDAVHEAVEYEK